MTLGIEASNIRGGGGLTHLTEILNNIEQTETGFGKIIIWSSASTLSKLPERDWLIKKSNMMIDKSFFTAILWQIFQFKGEAKKESCSLIFAPGSTFLSSFRPFVTMSQNMLPFELNESFRFKNWITRLRFLVLYVTQSYTFKKAEAVIFLTNYAMNFIINKVQLKSNKTTIIPHGISKTFLKSPKPQHDINYYSDANPYRLLYVSIVTAYKHQWNVSKAVSKLRKQGYPVVLDLVGPKSRDGFTKLKSVMKDEDPDKEFINYHGIADQEKLKSFYQNADAFVFASSCENMPIILIEAMSAGLPIASSNRGPMPEILKENGLYFDPESVFSITDALEKLIKNRDSRYQMSKNSYKDINDYTWQACSKNTFSYLATIAKGTIA